MRALRQTRLRPEKEPQDIDRQDIDKMMRLIRAAVRPYPKAALFELYDEGFVSPFEQLVSCVISARTRDEATLVISRRLFSEARSPEEMGALSLQEIDELIRPCTFHGAKAAQIQRIARKVAGEFGGELPCDLETLLSFPGVGPKTAHLVLGIACGIPRVGVDIHVHRVTNRWGYVAENTPEKTTAALERKLPRKHWVEINKLLVPFGKHVCTGILPRCSACPVRAMCRQVGVDEHR